MIQNFGEKFLFFSKPSCHILPILKNFLGKIVAIGLPYVLVTLLMVLYKIMAN